MENHGVLLGERPGDYRADFAGGALPFIVRNETGNWESYLPFEEIQYNPNGNWKDSMSCVTFAELSGIEAQEYALTDEIPNYSDRWIAKMSETTPQGNYLWKVADAIRKYGLVKEESYPVPEGDWDWNEYHKPIPEPLLSQLKAEGQEWLKRWDVKYETVDFSKESLMKHLKMAPLTVIIPGHAVLNFNTTKQVIEYFDTYPPHLKQTTSVVSAMKVMLYPKEQAIPDKHLLVDIKWMDSGKQVVKLREALLSLGWYEAKGLPDMFAGDKWAQVVLNYQKANLSRLSWSYWFAIMYHKGKLVDQETRNVINSSLK